MKNTNWSELALKYLKKSRSKSNLDTKLSEKIYFSNNFSCAVSDTFELSIHGDDEVLTTLLTSYESLVKKESLDKKIATSSREVESYLRDKNHLSAFNIEDIDFKKIDFYISEIVTQYVRSNFKKCLDSTSDTELNTFQEKVNWALSFNDSLKRSFEEHIYFYQILPEQWVIRLNGSEDCKKLLFKQIEFFEDIICQKFIANALSLKIVAIED